MIRFTYIGKRLRRYLLLIFFGICIVFTFIQYKLPVPSTYNQQNGRLVHLQSLREHLNQHKLMKNHRQNQVDFDQLRQQLHQMENRLNQQQQQQQTPVQEHLQQLKQKNSAMHPHKLLHLPLNLQQMQNIQKNLLRQQEQHSDNEQLAGRQLINKLQYISADPRKLLHINDSSTVKITIHMPNFARLGNLMFGYAALLGIARRNGFVPVIVTSDMEKILDTFQLSTPVLLELDSSNWERVEEKLAGTFDERMNNITTDILSKPQRFGSSQPEWVSLKGYYQSWKYFDFIRSDIIAEFKFREQYAQAADEFIRVSRMLLQDPTRGQIVGIHVRRGDLITPSARERGYTMATAGYIARAMTYIEARLNGTDIVYIVCSEDINWFREKVHTESLTKHYIIYSPNGQTSDAIDLAILARCDHMIESVGTYSWWAGYLIDGIVVYYSNFPAKNSALGREYKAEDHFPLHWIPIR